MRAAGLALAGLLAAVAASAQDPLVCGAPQLRDLAAGATHSFPITATSGSSVVIQTGDVSGTLGLIRMQVRGPGGMMADTCTGLVQFTAPPGPLELKVSQCNGSTGGQYNGQPQRRERRRRQLRPAAHLRGDARRRRLRQGRRG
jgi:hypothetical protein